MANRLSSCTQPLVYALIIYVDWYSAVGRKFFHLCSQWVRHFLFKSLTRALFSWLGIALTTSTWLLSLRVMSLWHRKSLVVYSVYIFYFLMQAVTWSLTLVSIHHMYREFTLVITCWRYFDRTASNYCVFCSCQTLWGDNSGYHWWRVLCSRVFLFSSLFISLTKPQISFEVYVLILQILHHYQRSQFRRGQNLPRFALLHTLYRDGYTYFVVVVGIRLMTCLVVGRS